MYKVVGDVNLRIKEHSELWEYIQQACEVSGLMPATYIKFLIYADRKEILKCRTIQPATSSPPKAST